MNKARQRILNFFDKEISPYVLEDLDELSKIRPNIEGLRACAIPQVMLIFSVLDFIGYLIRKDPNAKKSDTSQNIKAILGKDYGLFPPVYEEESDKLIQLFRHGIYHQFFSKASGVAKGSNVSSLIYLLPHDTRPNLNVDMFTRDFQIAINKLWQTIKSGNHDDLAVQMNTRLDILNKEDYIKLQSLSYGSK